MTAHQVMRAWPEHLLIELQQAQRNHGGLSVDLLEQVARSLDIASNDVFGVASFYSFLAIRPAGRHVIRICKSVPCYLKKSQTIIETVQKELGIKPGETTPDGRFSLEYINCIGLCDQAPAMMVNSDPHGDLNPGRITSILESYK